MKKITLLVLAVFALAALANITNAKASPSIDPGHVGLVTQYTPDETITIMDKNGDELTFELAPEVKIVPKHRADMLIVGAYVTVVTPNNVENGKNLVAQIVIHPQPPAGFPIPSATVVPTDTAAPTETALPSETATEVPTETATITETTTSEPETPTATPTATEEIAGTSTQADAEAAVTAFVNWLASFFRQFLSSAS